MGVTRIQGLRFAVDVLDYTLFIDNKRGAMRHRELVIQDSVLRRNLNGAVWAASVLAIAINTAATVTRSRVRTG
jgi:hypothetical protein